MGQTFFSLSSMVKTKSSVHRWLQERFGNIVYLRIRETDRDTQRERWGGKGRKEGGKGGGSKKRKKEEKQFSFGDYIAFSATLLCVKTKQKVNKHSYKH